MTFKLTERQYEAQAVLGGEATHLCLFGGSRCVSGDTIIDGQVLTIKELAEIGNPVEVITSRGKQLAEPPFKKGICKLLRFKIESGETVEVTPDHRFYNGVKWVRASSLVVSDFLAVRSSSTAPPVSTLGFSLLKFPSSVQRLIGKLLNYQGDYFSHYRRYGQQLHSVQSYGQACCASQCGVQERTHSSQYQATLASLSRESGTHIQNQREHDGEYIQTYQQLYHPSTLGDSLNFDRVSQYLNFSSWQISVPFPDLHQICQQFQRRFFRHGSIAKAWYGALYQFCRFFYLSYDKPCVDGFELKRIESITETAEKEYYTLHVPVSEQYFANGILHHNSGKTFLLIRNVVMRALKAANSRHAVFRFRFNAIKASIIQDTLPKVMQIAFPGVPYSLNKTDFYATLSNGSEIWFGGLDDKERTEKILGMEFVTIYFNEASQIPRASIDMALTRLAQKATQRIGIAETELVPRAYYDLNPPSKAHWSYQRFIEKRDPETRKPIAKPTDYDSFKLSPSDNVENLTSSYLQQLESLPASLRLRFLVGDWADATPNALFTFENMERNRSLDGKLPEFLRIVIGVDPSGAGENDSTEHDAIGIVAGALGIDGKAYLLEDCTVTAGPATWGRIATTAFDRLQADCIVGEANYGGAMVQHVIQTSRSRTPYKAVNATRGKHIRAEPISALYEENKIVHVGYFPELEDELCAFTTTGYLGGGSPNRADAWVWVLAELFSGIVAPRKTRLPTIPTFSPSVSGMGY